MDNRSSMGMPPLKHVVDDLLNIPYNNTSVQTITLAKGVINPNYVSSNTDVRNGSKITKITILIDCIPLLVSDTSDVMIFDWYVAFNIAGAQALPAPNSVGGSDLLQQVFHQDQGMIQLVNNSGVGIAATNTPYVVRLELNIPRAWQVLNRDDQIQLLVAKSALLNTSNAMYFKVKAIYKEIYP